MKFTFIAVPLIAVLSWTSVHAQAFEEIRETGRLNAAAASPGAAILSATSPRRIEFDDAAFEVLAVEVRMADGTLHHGIRLLLEGSGDVERIYLDAGEVAQFRDELNYFALWQQSLGPCASRHSCMHGIARCGPGGGLQAYCPGLYWTPEGEKAFVLSTPRSSFRYPTAQIGTLVASVEAVMAEANP